MKIGDVKGQQHLGLEYDSADEEVELLVKERSFMQAISTGTNTDSDLRYLTPKHAVKNSDDESLNKNKRPTVKLEKKLR